MKPLPFARASLICVAVCLPDLAFAQRPAATSASGSIAPAAASQTPSASPSLGPLDTDATLATRFDAVLVNTGGLTADEVAQRAQATSFDVAARRQETLAAAAAVDQALVGFFPRLTGLARYAHLSPIAAPVLGRIVAAPSVMAPADSTDVIPVPAGSPLVSVPLSFPVPTEDVRFQASLTIPISDYLLRTVQAYAAATHSRRAAELSERAARARSGFDARVAYYNWVRAKLSVTVAEMAVEQIEGHGRDVQRSYEVGAVSLADVMRVQSQVASAQLLLARAQNLATVMEDQIRTAMHEPTPRVFSIGEDVRSDLAGADIGTFAALYEEALARRPELMALVETVGSMRQQANVARAGAWPRLDAFGDVLSANPNPRYFPQTQVFNTTWDVGVSLTWSPNDLGIALAAARAAGARAAQAEAQRQALRDQVRNELMQAFAAVHEADVAQTTTATGLSAAEESYRVRRVLFRNGRATSVELTDAETDLTRARLDSINAHIDARIARARLQHATGRDATDSL